MTTGLVLGKFAPLHRGHQLVIETAMAEMQDVIVLIYDAPETTRCPLTVRADWIRRLYPQVRVDEAWDGPTQVGAEPEITAMHDRYLVERFQRERITHVYSSEFYGEHVSRALGAVDRRVDEARERVKISATQIREDPYGCRAFLDPLVYRDLIVKCVFLGAPSTGKTTLASALAARWNTVWMPEYGREYWQQHQVDKRLSLEQLVEIAEGHRRREDALSAQANRYLFVDTDASTTRHFSHYYHGQAAPQLERWADECAQRYDLCFLCGDEIPFDDTWDRSGPLHRQVFQRQIEADLVRRRRTFVRLRGTLAERIERVTQTLGRFTHYDSPLDGWIAPAVVR